MVKYRRLAVGGLLAAAALVTGQQAQAVIPFQDGFESGITDWSDYGAAPVRVGTGAGTVGAPSSVPGSSFHLELHNAESSYEAVTGSAGYSFFGGNQNSVSGEWYHAMDIYVDLDPSSPTFWGVPTAINNSVPAFFVDSSPQMLNPADNQYRRAYEDESNYAFLIPSAGTVQVNALYNTPLATITESGWYRFIQTYETSGPVVQNEFYVIDLQHNGTISAPVSLLSGTYTDTKGTADPADDVFYGPLQSSQLAGNGYVWVVGWQNDFAGNVIAMDNLTAAYGEPVIPAFIPEPASLALIGLGAVAALRRRRQA